MNPMMEKITPGRNDYRFIGTIRPRNASEIHGSNWTLGCEVLDRDFADYDQYKEYIVPLGIKTVRFQGGWAKTEKKAGVYDFTWLDRLVDDAVSRGLNVLLETDYGNSVYEGGGGWDLSGGFPTSETALSAWDKWVEAMAARYQGKVRDWAMWNEPDINPKHTPEDIVRFNIRTAKIIRRIIPDARIAGLSLAGTSPDFFRNCLNAISRENAFSLFTWFIYHGYRENPDDSYRNVEELQEVLSNFSSTIRMRQGENGCPSEKTNGFALAGIDWTEFSQAKWDLRRMLGDLGHDAESSIFTICDFNHIGREINRKGLIRANADHSVVGPKLAYYSVQNLTAVFDDRLERIPYGKAAVLYGNRSSLYSYRKKETDTPLVVFWDSSARPAESNAMNSAQVILKNGTLQHPVWVDLLSGKIYEIPAESIRKDGDFTIFEQVPIYDSPCLITERTILPVQHETIR